MVTLTADNRNLSEGQKYSYTDNNYLSGVNSFQVSNSDGFVANQYVLLGEFGSEGAEVMKIQTVTAATHTLAFTTNTKFAHPESTKITIIPYNQVRFYWTATATFATTSLLSTENVQADDIFTRYSDTTNTTGFGWFVFYNSTTLDQTGPSNAIPYANFSRNNVKRILDNFYSMLNNSELKLVSFDDSLSWLNEAYAIACNELNLVNQEYKASAETTLSVTSGTQEYSLPTDFSNIISVYDSTRGTYSVDDVYLKEIPLEDLPNWDSIEGNTPRYYIRGAYIGISPSPTTDATYTYRYQTKSDELTSYYDTVDLPDNAFYALKDFMLYRASQKLMRPGAESYYELFNNSLSRMKMYSTKRHGDPDSWEIADNANV